MTDEERVSGAGGPPDPAEVLSAVLGAVRSTESDMLSVLRPVLGPGGEVLDFEVVADSHFLAQLAGGPVVGRRVRAVMPVELAERIVALSGEAHRTGVPTRSDLLLTGSGDTITVVTDPGGDHAHPIGEVTRIPSEGFVVLVGRDVTEARAARRALLASEQRYRRLVEHSRDPILVATAGGVVTYASPAVRVVVHTEPDDLVGRPLTDVVHPADAGACADLLRDVADAPPGASRAAALRVRGLADDDAWVAITATNWCDDAAVGGIVLNVRDVTEQRAAQERLEQEALEDPLTGLANRRWLERALEDAVNRHARTAAPFAVVLLDVDHFKAVNDNLGHPAGDQLLTDLAARLKAVLRPSDTAARLGGDEFVVIAQDLRSAEDVVVVAHRVLDRCAGTYRLAGVPDPIRVTVSIGVAASTDVAPQGPDGPHRGRTRHGEGSSRHGVTGAELLRRADAALYRAKRLGRSRIELADGSRTGVGGGVGLG